MIVPDLLPPTPLPLPRSVRGRLTLLRACNNLLSRISKSQHTVLCGRVAMLVSMLFPLHERSAMNLSGTVNTAHKADVDGEARAQLRRRGGRLSCVAPAHVLLARGGAPRRLCSEHALTHSPPSPAGEGG